MAVPFCSMGAGEALFESGGGKAKLARSLLVLAPVDKSSRETRADVYGGDPVAELQQENRGYP
jgi:uncharacterized FlgJ-related protein